MARNSGVCRMHSVGQNGDLLAADAGKAAAIMDDPYFCPFQPYFISQAHYP